MATNETIIDVDDQNDDEVEVPGEENKPKLKSVVWQHFPYKKGAKSTKCKHCKKVLACGTRLNGTSGLLNHLRNTCVRSPLYKAKKNNPKNQSTLNFKPKDTQGGGSLTKHSFSQEKCRLGLAKMCIKDNRPFSIVDDEGFKEYSWELNPEFIMPSRWTVARDCITVFEQEAEKVKHLLKGQTVCLTTDTWSSVQNINYMCLTVHWIDDTWVLQKRILNFCPIDNHRGDTIGSLVYECLKKWGIETVFTITVDSASSNDGAIRFLKRMLKGPNDILGCKYLHLRCCAHIINLVVRDGLEEQFDSVTRIRNAVTYVRSSPARYKSFEDCVACVEVKSKLKPSLDVDTRWNSTYLMLETAVVYEDAFDRLYLIDSSYGAYFPTEAEEDVEGSIRKRKRKHRVIGAPSGVDWDAARNLIDYLKIFFDVTTKFPILSKIARHVLAMPISTVASESAFSTSGRVIDKYRSSLNTETTEALICAQDWIRCTRVDLELGCSMKNKDIDEFNKKMAGLKIGNTNDK